MNYMGSKASISSSIVPIIQKCIMCSGYDGYIEPFVGGGAMLFYMLQKFPNIERAIVNDITFTVDSAEPDRLIPIVELEVDDGT